MDTARWVSVIALAGAAIAVDVARFVFEIPGIGWANFLFVWAAVHQLGYWWASRDAAGDPIPTRTGWSIFAASLSAVIVLMWIGWYPVAMIGIPGAELTNMTPPTFAICLLGLAQAGMILGLQHAVAAATQRIGIWRAVVAVSGVIMTVYLWHLSAMTIVAAVGLFAFGGVAFEIETDLADVSLGLMSWTTKTAPGVVLTTAYRRRCRSRARGSAAETEGS